MIMKGSKVIVIILVLAGLLLNGCGGMVAEQEEISNTSSFL